MGCHTDLCFFMPTWVPWPLVEKISPISFSVISRILPPVSTVFSPHLDRRLSPQGLYPLKCFLKFTLARSATAPSYNMALITTSTKWNKSLLTFNVWLHYFDCCSTFVQRLLVCVCVCVFVCVCVCFSLCVIIVFFSDCRIYLFSSLAARVFNKLTRYSLLVCLTVCDVGVLWPNGWWSRWKLV